MQIKFTYAMLSKYGNDFVNIANMMYTHFTNFSFLMVENEDNNEAIFLVFISIHTYSSRVSTSNKRSRITPSRKSWNKSVIVAVG